MNLLQFFTKPILPFQSRSKDRSLSKEKISNVNPDTQAYRKEMREMKMQMEMKKAEREAIRMMNGCSY